MMIMNQIYNDNEIDVIDFTCKEALGLAFEITYIIKAHPREKQVLSMMSAIKKWYEKKIGKGS